MDRRMPEDIDGLKQLVRDLSGMYSAFDADYVDLKEKAASSLKEIARLNALLEEELSTVEEDLATAEATANEELDKIEDFVNKKFVIPKWFGIGMVTGADFGFQGFQVGASALFQIKNTFFFSFSVIEALRPQQISTNFNLTVGYWIF
jgi:hypothetical protein